MDLALFLDSRNMFGVLAGFCCCLYLFLLFSISVAIVCVATAGSLGCCCFVIKMQMTVEIGSKILLAVQATKRRLQRVACDV